MHRDPMHWMRRAVTSWNVSWIGVMGSHGQKY
jgi:hypothetical protein